MSENLKTFIEESRKKGVPDDALRETLMDNGWDKNLVVKVMYDIETPKPANEIEKSDKTKKQNITLWDTFTHILMFISLAVFSFSLGMILHQFTDKYVPDPTWGADRNMYSNSYEITGFLSALIVSTPILFSLFIYNYNRTRKYIELKNLITRKILIYLTLIYTFGHILVKLIIALTDLLEGTLSLNFGLHFVITVGINLIIFLYFLYEVREARKFEK